MKRLILYFIAILKTPLFILKGSSISWTTRVCLPSSVIKSKIGKYNYIGQFTTLKKVKMGNYCSIAAGTNIGGMEHPYQYPSTSPRLFPTSALTEKETIIEDDVWIGANAIVRQGVRLGRGCVIGAGAVVLEDVAPYSISVGTPAKHLKYRFSDKKIAALQSSEYWLHSPSKAKQLTATLDQEV